MPQPIRYVPYKTLFFETSFPLGTGYFYDSLTTPPPEPGVVPLPLSPIPRACRWTGPLVHNISCDGCALGYAALRADLDCY